MSFISPHKYLLVITFTLASLNLYAQPASSWQLQGPSLILPFASQVDNRTVTLAIAYEKSFFRCKPTVALVVMQGRRLGSVQDTTRSSSNRNKLRLNIDGKLFVGEGETQVNQYSNGIEVTSFFSNSVIESLRSPSNIAISIGQNAPLFSGKSLNSINADINSVIQSCERS